MQGIQSSRNLMDICCPRCGGLAEPAGHEDARAFYRCPTCDRIWAAYISAVAREGRATEGVGIPPDDADLAPLLDAILRTVPEPLGDPDEPLQALVTNLDASEYLGRLAIGRVVRGM